MNSKKMTEMILLQELENLNIFFSMFLNFYVNI